MKSKIISLLLCAALLLSATTAFAGDFDLPEVNPDTHEAVVKPGENTPGDSDEGFETGKTQFDEIKAPIDVSELSIKLSKSVFTYNGKPVTPKVLVNRKDGKAVPSTAYTVNYPKARTKIGYYTVSITFKGDYKGSTTRSFSIVPKGTSITKLTAGKKSVTVKWKKQASKTTGYQIQCATDKSFKKNLKSATVKKPKAVKATVKKLKRGKKYFVRIRTYTKVGKKNCCSSWSAPKQIKIKK